MSGDDVTFFLDVSSKMSLVFLSSPDPVTFMSHHAISFGSKELMLPASIG